MSKETYVVIPSLNPDEKLANTVKGLLQIGFSHIVLVDDGSDTTHRGFFPAGSESVTVLHHRVNRGKGAALKTAFRYIRRDCPDAAVIVTVDGDGQHAPADVLACVNAVDPNRAAAVLGCRDFSGKEVPRRSRFGNHFTSFVFRVLCGMKISDTQTGLRAFPAKLLPLLLSIRGERFEYETNMLLQFKQHGIYLKEVAIQTVYLEENASSHFRPLRDSLRIYRFILGFAVSSALSALVDILLFAILYGLTGSVILSTAVARAVSSLVNYTVNRKTVFDYKGKKNRALVRYYLLAIPQMLVSAGAVSLLVSLTGASRAGGTFIKVIVDLILFFISYRIQQNWVFATRRKGLRPEKKAETEKMPLRPKTVVKRSLLVVATAIGMVIVTVFSACFLICYGPSESLRNMLVLSAEQASATKWAPYLFLPKKTVKKIIADSEKINEDTVSAEDYSQTADEDEWDGATDGMKLVFINRPKYKAYLLLVRDPKRIRVGVASENFKTAREGKRIFDLVAKYNAVAAINGGEFVDSGGQGNGATPMGLTYAAGKMVWSDGLKRTFIGFDKNDRLICRESMTQKQAEELGIRDAVSFQNGNVIIEQTDEKKIKFYYGDNNTGTAQRTAIGQRADGTVILLVTDGRSADSIGATRNDVIEVMAEYGAVNAGMLDGGSSAMLYYRNYFDVYRDQVDKSTLDGYQLQGLVNRYKAFVKPRRIPTYFIVTEAP